MRTGKISSPPLIGQSGLPPEPQPPLAWGKKTSESTQTEMPYFYHALGLTDPKYFQPISLYVLRLKQYIAW